MARAKQTARRMPMRAPREPKPFPKGRHVLETLYNAIKQGNINLAKYVSASKIYGKENLCNAIDQIFKDSNLAEEIFSFVYWKVSSKNKRQEFFKTKIWLHVYLKFN